MYIYIYLIKFRLFIFASLISKSPKTQGHFLFRKYQYSSTPVWLTAISLPLIFKPSLRKGVSSPSSCSQDHNHTDSFVLHLSQQSYYTSCPRMASLSSEMNNCHPHPNHAWKLCDLKSHGYQIDHHIFFESAEYHHTLSDKIDTTITTYVAMLNQHNNTQVCVAIHGKILGSIREWEVSKEEDHHQFSKRLHSTSPKPERSTKRCAPNESLFTCAAGNDADAFFLAQSQELTQKLVQNHLLDIKSTKHMVVSTKWVPVFLDSKWNNVLAGKAVNLDAISQGCTLLS